MCAFQSSDPLVTDDAETYSEAVASQEEMYLEKVEEDLRTVLISDDPLPPPSEAPEQLRKHAIEELVTGDSDDPPLSEEVVESMLPLDDQLARRGEA